MKLYKLFLPILMLAALLSPALAQSDQQIAQLLQSEFNNVRMRSQETQQMYQLAQMGGSQADFQRLAQEQKLHEWMANYLQNLWQNPAPLRTPDGFKRFTDRVLEYDYRISQADYRPYEQIRGRIQAYTQQQVWQSTTPEGQRAFNQNLNTAQRNFDNSQAAVRANSQQRDAQHEAFINSTIWEHSQWQNPNNGSTYLVPHSYQQPYIQGPGGYYYQMTPGNY
ncbi:MAG: hypothetical protein WC314_24890 [Vulcanimicrobiota bacterium]